MNPLKLSNVTFSQTNWKYNTEIFWETIKQKRYIDEVLSTSKNSNKVYNWLKELFLLTKDDNPSSFLNYLKNSFDNLTSNQKVDILYYIYKSLDKKVVEVFFKEINLHKINNIENIINRDKKWDKIFLYIYPEYKENKIDLENNSNLSQFINKVLDFDWKGRPHKNAILINELSTLVDEKFINDFVYNFNIWSIDLNQDDFYNINRLFLELVDKNWLLESLLDWYFHRKTDFWMQLKILEKILDNNLDIEKYPYIQYTIEKLYNSPEETNFKAELKTKYEKYMLKN